MFLAPFEKDKRSGLLWVGMVAVFAAIFSLPAVVLSEVPLKIVAPVPPGGGMDGLARHLAMRMADQSGEPIVVENRPGASGLVGTQYVAKSAGNGKTLLIGSSFVATNALTVESAPNPLKDLKPVIYITEAPIYLAVRSDLDVFEPADLEKLVQRCPQGLNCGAVPGQMALACERLRSLFGGGIVPIPYSGVVPAVNALVGGHVDFLFSTHASLTPMADAGKIRILGSLGSRAGKPPYHKLPLIKDTWPGFIMKSWSGIFAPVTTPDAVVAELNRRFNAALADPELKSLLEAQSYTVIGGKPEDLARQVAEDLELFQRIIDEIKKTSP